MTFKRTKPKTFNIEDIPIYIISYNRLDMLKLLIEWLEKRNYANIHIIDNKSTYPPLLEYLKNTPYKVYFMDQNYGHMVFWDSHQFDDVMKNQYYVITDADVLPTEECPSDFMEKFYKILQEFPKYTKVGFGLKTDDIPNHYKFKNDVIEWEANFHKTERKYENFSIYCADIDTTFALYRPSKRKPKHFYRAIRTGAPLQARHLPWYIDNNNLSENEKFYQSIANTTISTWNPAQSEDDIIYKKENIKYSFVERIFSIKNSTGKKRKVITILGFKFKIKSPPKSF